jgi:2-polyprenyl-3-methyl-5-hydroxy-6-metoxy-1,4-benzoquinol methylase
MGCCCVFKQGVVRLVGAENVAEFDGFLKTRAAQDYLAKKQLVSTRRLGETEITVRYGSTALPDLRAARPGAAIFEHERVLFASYPREWPPEMLWAAGRLTLDLGRAVLAEGYGLKDAAPCNILFRGSEPVFIDALSFERRHPGDPTWKPCAQFIRAFLLPLLASRRWGLAPGDVFATRHDGLEPEEVYRWCGRLERFHPSILSLVSIPVWLSRRANPDDQALYQTRPLADTERARYIVESVFHRMERALESLRPIAPRRSHWSDYMEKHSYNDPAFAAKEAFVKEALAEFKPAHVLDAGANTGHFSVLAAQSGAAVVAIDLDPGCMGELWRRARERKLNILPLVVNLARPTPATGWRNRECPSFLDRAAGAFDGLLMLAVLHHLLVTERIPLGEILAQAAELTTSLAVIEFVAPQDAMFRRLARGRDALHAALTEQAFEAACGEHFEIVRKLTLPGAPRTMYCVKKKGAP